MNYLAEMAKLTKEQRLAFYACPAHTLTVAARDIWSSDEQSMDKVEQLKWLNEIQHRVTAKIIALQASDHNWSERDSWNSIEDWIAQDSRNESRVLWAIRAALQSLESSDPTKS